MRFLNLLGNKFFSLAFSWLLGQPIKDTFVRHARFCGNRITRPSPPIAITLATSTRFGDFDLIFGAVKLNSKDY